MNHQIGAIPHWKLVDTSKETVFWWLSDFLLMFLAFNSMPADPISIYDKSPTGMWHIFQQSDNGNYGLAMRHLLKTKKKNSPSSHKHFCLSRIHLPQVWFVSPLHLYEYCVHQMHSLFGYATFPYKQN